MSNRTLPYILAMAKRTVWAIDPDFGQTLLAILERRVVRGEQLSDADLEAAIGEPKAALEARSAAADSFNGPRATGPMIVPVFGMLTPRGNFLNSSGQTSMEGLTSVLRAAEANPDVTEVILDIDSPGGSVFGIDELAQIISDMQTPVTAVANHMMASAAYWIGSAADWVVAAPSAVVGSIGVFTMHQDLSAAAEKAGVRTTLIHAGRRKVEGHPFGELSEEALANTQESVDATYAAFTDRVAAGRGVTAELVRGAAFGEGAVLTAQQALSAGMIDQVATLDQVIAGSLAREQDRKAQAASVAADITARSERLDLLKD